MIVYRLSKKKYCTDLSGKGAEKSGGRWNSKGTALLYTCDSRALSTAEISVHIPLGIIPNDYFLSKIQIPEDITIFELDPTSLPHNWRSFPHPNSTQEIGNSFVNENKFLVMKVPSAVVQGDFNFLINPKHIDFNKISLLNTEPFNFNERLFKR